MYATELSHYINLKCREVLEAYYEAVSGERNWNWLENALNVEGSFWGTDLTIEAVASSWKINFELWKEISSVKAIRVVQN